jgi:hypothetical protein
MAWAQEGSGLPRLSSDDAWILTALGPPGSAVDLAELIERMDFIERSVPGFETFSFGLRRLQAVGFLTVEVNPAGGVRIRSEPAMALVRRAILHGSGITSVVKVARAIDAPDPVDRVPDDRSLGPLPGFTPDAYERAYRRRTADFEAGLAELPGLRNVGAEWVFDDQDPAFLDQVRELHERLAVRLDDEEEP